MSVDGLRRLMLVPGVGSARALKLAESFRDWACLADATESALVRAIGAAGSKLVGVLADIPEPEELRSDVWAVCVYDEDWPDWCRDLMSPPAVLYGRGSRPRADAIAVVGTRSPTLFGKRVVAEFVDSAAEQGVGIVSGLARGIDAMAHHRALEAGTPTWAILGGGVDQPTPIENLDLAAEILGRGGGLLSEHPPGAEPNAQRLVARNRLQAASSKQVLIAQCGIPSGTLHTARFAIEIGRRLVVARPKPAWVDEPESSGNVALSDEQGCDPAVLGAKGELADRIRRRKPVADLVVCEAKDVAEIWQR